MILVLLLGCLFASAAEDLPEAPPPQPCNCQQNLQSEETSTDFPPTFPTTSFTCWGRYDGYYADVEVDCTIFHYCQTWHFPTGLNETVKWDFACPQSTIFNQKVLSCTPPSISFDCQESPNYYWVNYNLTTKTTTPAPTTELTTPVPNSGQQLIVGGIGAQSATIGDSDHPSTPSHVVTSSDEEQTNSVTPESNLDTKDTIGNAPQSIRFPDSEHQSVPSHSATSDQALPEWLTPAHNFDQQQILFPDSERQDIPSQFSTSPNQVETYLTDPKHSFRQEFGGTVSQPTYFSDSEHTGHSVTILGSESAAPVHNIQQLVETVPQPTSFSYSEHPSTPSEYVEEELRTPVHSFRQEIQGTETPSFKDSEPSNFYHPSTSYNPALQHATTSSGVVQEEEFTTPQHDISQEFRETELTSFPDSELPYSHSQSPTSLDQVQTEVTGPVRNIVELLQGAIPQPTSFSDPAQLSFSTMSLDTKLKDSVHEFEPTSVPESEHPYNPSDSSTSFDKVQTEVTIPVHNIVQLLQGTVPQPTSFPDSAQPSYSATSLEPVDTGLKTSVDNFEQELRETARQPTSLPDSEQPSSPSHSSASLDQVQVGVTAPVDNIVQLLQGTFPQSTSFPDSAQPSYSATPLEPVDTELKDSVHNFEHSETAPQSTSVLNSEHRYIPSYSSTPFDHVETEVTIPVQNIVQLLQGTVPQPTSFPDSVQPSYSATSLEPVDTEVKTSVHNFEQLSETAPQSTFVPDSEHPYSPSYSSTPFDNLKTEVTAPVHNVVQLLQGTVPQPTSFPDSVQPSYSATSLEPGDTDLKDPVHNFEQKLRETAPQPTSLPDSEHPYSPSYSTTSGTVVRGELTTAESSFREEFQGTQATSFPDSEPFSKPSHSIPLEQVQPELKGLQHNFVDLGENAPLSTTSYDSEHSSIPAKSSASLYEVHAYTPSYSATSLDQVQPEVTNAVLNFGQEFRGTEGTSFPYTERVSTSSYSVTSLDQVQSELKAPVHNIEQQPVGTAPQPTSFQISGHPFATNLDQVQTELKVPVHKTADPLDGTVLSTFFPHLQHTSHSATSLEQLQEELITPQQSFKQEFGGSPSQSTFSEDSEHPATSHSSISLDKVQAEVTDSIQKFAQEFQGTEAPSFKDSEPTATYNPAFEYSATYSGLVQGLSTSEQSLKHEVQGTDATSLNWELPSTPLHSAIFSEHVQPGLKAPEHNFEEQIGGTVLQPTSFQYSEASTIYDPPASSSSVVSFEPVQTEVKAPLQNFGQEIGGTASPLIPFQVSEQPSLTSVDQINEELKAPVHSFVQQTRESVPQPTPFQYSEASALFSPPAPSHSAIPTDELTHPDPSIQTELKAPEQNVEQEQEGTAPQPTSFQISEQPSATFLSPVEDELKAPVHSFVQQTGENVPQPTPFQHSEASALYSPPAPSHSDIISEQVQTEVKTPLQDFEQELEGTAPQPASFLILEQPSATSLSQIEELKAPVYSFEQQTGESIPQPTSFQHSEPSTSYSPSAPLNSATSLDQVQSELTTAAHNFRPEIHGTGPTFVPDYEHPTTLPHSITSLDGVQEELKPTAHISAEDFGGTLLQSTFFPDSEQLSDSASSVNPRETEVKAAVTITEQQPVGTVPQTTLFLDSEHPSATLYSATPLDGIQTEFKDPLVKFEEQFTPQSTSFYHPENPSISENSPISLNEVEVEVTTAIHNFGQQLENAEPTSFSYSPTSVNQVQRDSEHPSTSLHSGTFLEQEHIELKAPAQNSEQQLGGTVSPPISVQYSEPSSIYYPSTPSHSATILDQVQTEIRTQEQSIRQEFGGTEPTSFPDSEHPSTPSLHVIPLNQVQSELEAPVLIETVQQSISFPDSQLPHNPSDSSTSFDQVQTEVTIPVHNIVQLLQGTVPQSTSFPDSVQPSYSATSLEPVDTEVKTSVHNFEQLSETAPQSTFAPDSEHPYSPSYSSTHFENLKTEVTAPVHNIVQLLQGTAPQPTSLLDSAQPLYSANSLEPVDTELKDSVHKFQEELRETVPHPTSFPDSEHSSYSAASSVQVQGELTTPEHIFRQEVRGPEMTPLTSEYASTPSYSTVSSVQVQAELKAPLQNSEEIVGTASQLTSVQDTETSPVASLDHVEAELKAPADNFVQQLGGSSPQSTSFEISEHSTAFSLDHVEIEVKAPVHNFVQEVSPQSTPFQESENTSIPPHSIKASNLTQTELKAPVDNLGQQVERTEATSLPHLLNPSHSATSLEQVHEELTTPQQSFKQEFGESESQSTFSEDSEHPATPPHSFVFLDKLQAEVTNPVHSSGQEFQGTEAPAFKDSESSTIYHESATYNPAPEYSATSWSVVQELSTPVQNFKEEVQGIGATSFPNSENPFIPSHTAITLEHVQPELKAPAHNFEEQTGGTVLQPTSFQYSEGSTIYDPPAASPSAVSFEPVHVEVKAPLQNFVQEDGGTASPLISFQVSEQPSATTVDQINEELKAPVHSFVQQTGESVPQPTPFQYSEASALFSPSAPSHSAIPTDELTHPDPSIQTELKAPEQNVEQEQEGATPQPTSFQISEQPSATSLSPVEDELKAPVHSFVQETGESVPLPTSFQNSEPSTIYSPPTSSHSDIISEQVQTELKTPLQDFEQELGGAAPQPTSFQILEQSSAASLDQQQTELKAPVQKFEQQVGETSPQSTSFYDPEHPSVLANSPTPVHETQSEPVHNFGQQLEEAEATYFPDLKHSSHSASSDQAQAELNAPLQNLELAETAPQAISFQNSEQPSADEIQDFARTELPSFPESEHQSIPSHSLTSADIVQTASELAHPNSSPEFTQSTVIPDSRLWTVLMNPTTLVDSVQAVTSPNLIESWSGSGEASGEVANDEDESQAIK